MLRDSAGEAITVGCRVAECDFSFGDGLVESVEVPSLGGGFNVGVKWDDPAKGGPAWSAEGGGRSSQHLLVIEPAPQQIGNTFLPPKDLVDRAFKRRFGRSPTPSEAELDEGEWDEIIEEASGEESGEEGGEQGGEEGGEKGGAAPQFMKPGARIQMAFGTPASWFGGLVGRQTGDSFEIGFDDGDFRVFSADHLAEMEPLQLLKPAELADGGLADNQAGEPAAAAFVTFRNGREKVGKTVGVLVGKEASVVAGLPTYMAHHVVSAMFATDTARPRRSAGPTLQDRQGFHTFRRGDVVAYQKLEKGDAPYQAVVFGCMFKERGSGDADEGDGEESEHGGAGNELQARKILILYDREAHFFFLGAWPHWQRICEYRCPLPVPSLLPSSCLCRFFSLPSQ